MTRSEVTIVTQSTNSSWGYTNEGEAIQPLKFWDKPDFLIPSCNN